MKPAWDQLMQEYKGNPGSLVADVDCTAAGQPLCEKSGVRGYPTIKYGDPNKLTDYQGGRDFNSLKQFADNNLGPKCGPENLDLCKGAVKTTYERLMKMESQKLEDETRSKRKELRALEEEVELYKNASRYVRKLERANKAAEKKAEKEKKKAEEAAKKAKGDEKSEL
jgi:hypothetical protein